MKVFLFGSDNIGWSIDEDRNYTEFFLKDLGIARTNLFFLADVIHSVWWNLLLTFRAYLIRYNKIIAVATNEIDTNSKQFLKAKKFVNLWIAPSSMMQNRLELAGVDVKYQPFYVDEKIFHKINKTQKKIAEELGINYDFFKDKLVIGSFQRDSLEADLSKPKIQKGPEILMEILSKLPKEKFILLLAGPRRHWIINQCKILGISYFYYGKEPKKFEDDIMYNILDKRTINKLYNLTDLYIVSSRSEGGPKAILESAFTKTMIMSTNVGIAPDFLHSKCIYINVEEVVQKIENILEGKDFSKIIEFNYEKAYNVASYEPMLNRWRDIYDYFETTYLV